jgi:four helix bundle suffix protein
VEYQTFSKLRLPNFEYTNDSLHDYWQYFQQARDPFVNWLDSDDCIIAANALITLLQRTMGMLANQIKKQGDAFMNHGGFRERMYQNRQDRRDDHQDGENSPECPKCGKHMRKRDIKNGKNAGGQFWGCTGYPDCRGTREVTDAVMTAPDSVESCAN